MIVFQRREPTSRKGEIWATDTHGDNLRQLTSSPGNKYRPEISPDGKWITYASNNVCWKMSLADSEARKLEPNKCMYPAISPDGRWVAFETDTDQIEIVASDGKAPPRFLPFIDDPQVPNPYGSANSAWPLHWTADGNGITYVRTKDGVSNIWVQPIDGSPARQLTNFDSMLIWGHSWSPDGKYLVMARGNLSHDAVMLTDLR